MSAHHIVRCSCAHAKNVNVHSQHYTFVMVHTPPPIYDAYGK